MAFSASETMSYFKEIERKFPHRISSAKQNSVLLNFESVKGVTFPNKYAACGINVVDADTFVTAKQMLDKGMNPLVLNMASELRPGGGWRKGSIAQEEALFYRSTYSMLLEPRKMCYPLKADEFIYSRDVFVFMDEQQVAMDWPDCYWMDCIAMPGIRNPPVTTNGRLSAAHERLLEQKIRAICATAVKHNNDSLVLSALLGCGAFHNPPEHVAQIFNRATDEVRKSFRQITFAVLGVGNAGLQNLRAFRNEFGQ